MIRFPSSRLIEKSEENYKPRKRGLTETWSLLSCNELIHADLMQNGHYDTFIIISIFTLLKCSHPFSSGSPPTQGTAIFTDWWISCILLVFNKHCTVLSVPPPKLNQTCCHTAATTGCQHLWGTAGLPTWQGGLLVFTEPVQSPNATTPPGTVSAAPSKKTTQPHIAVWTAGRPSLSRPFSHQEANESSNAAGSALGTRLSVTVLLASCQHCKWILSFECS